MSCGSRSGISSKTCCCVSPEARRSRTSTTRMRIPRTHGRSPHWVGLTVMRSGNSGTTTILRRTPQGCQGPPLPEDGCEDLPKRLLIVGAQRAELPDYETRLKGGDKRLDDRGFEQSCDPPMDDTHLTHVGAGRTWLVIAMRMTSGRSRLYASELTTTAGRLLVAVWSVNGNGATITSPKPNAMRAATPDRIRRLRDSPRLWRKRVPMRRSPRARAGDRYPAGR
jgi:hypothetical protein